MKGKMPWSAGVLLTVMMLVVSVFGGAGVAAAGDNAAGTGPITLTAANLDDLLAQVAGDAELAIPARGERYVGTADVSRYLASAVPEGRMYSLVRADRTAAGFTAVVEVSDRNVRWAQLTLHATVRGTELAKLEVSAVRLLTWPH